MVWLVEPPVASNPIMPLTIDSSVIICIKDLSNPSFELVAATFTASSVRSDLNSVFGLTKLEPGSCKPIISISIWLEFAVP